MNSDLQSAFTCALELSRHFLFELQEQDLKRETIHGHIYFSCERPLIESWIHEPQKAIISLDTAQKSSFIDLILSTHYKGNEQSKAAYARDDTFLVSREALNPKNLTQSFQILREDELPQQYLGYIRRLLRNNYGIHWDAQTNHLIRKISERVEFATNLEKKNHDVSFKKLLDSIPTDLVEIQPAGSSKESIRYIIKAVIEFLLLSNSIRLSYNTPQKFQLKGTSIDSEYLVSNIFGIPHENEGLMEICGGGGIIFPDHSNSSAKSPEGRMVYVSGASGTGKTTLSLSLAIDFAISGGFAYISHLEQSPNEILHYLYNISSRQNSAYTISTGITNLQKIINERNLNKKIKKGHIAIVDGRDASFDNFNSQNATIHSQISEIFPSSLFIFDPINAAQPAPSTTPHSRQAWHESIRTNKVNGANIIIVSEKTSNYDIAADTAEKICDIEFFLSVDVIKSAYSQRYIEIKKSRLQRVHRGKHPFSIRPRAGICVYPSEVAYNANSKNRIYTSCQDISFGWKQLDKIIGSRAFYRGDVIALTGDTGFKAQIGTRFCTAPKKPNERSMIISLKHSASALRLLISDFNLTEDSTFETVEIIDDLGIGFIRAGQILGRISSEISEQLSIGIRVSRVFIDNLQSWDLKTPSLADSVNFLPVLIDYFRKRQITLIVSDSDGIREPKNHSRMSQVLRSEANLVLNFTTASYFGTTKHIFRVNKSRAMRHLATHCEIKRNPSGKLEIDASFGRNFFLDNNRLKPRQNYLTFHSHYSRALRRHLHKVSRGCGIALQFSKEKTDNSPTSKHRPNTETETGLNIFQIDEYEKENAEYEFQKNGFILEDIPLNFNPKGQWLLSFLKKRVAPNRAQTKFLPFMEDCEVLVYNESDVGNLCTGDFQSWRLLAEHFEANNITLNCDSKSIDGFINLFLEIIVSSDKLLMESFNKHKPIKLYQLLESPECLSSIQLFQKLCRAERSDLSPVIKIWYSRLNDLNLEKGKWILGLLPNKVSVSGTSYLVSKSTTNSGYIDTEVLKSIYAPSMEIERQQSLSGFPISKKFYKSNSAIPLFKANIQSDLRLNDIYPVLEKSIQRSLIIGFSSCKEILNDYLHRLIHSENSDLKRELQSTIEDMKIVME